MTTIDRRTLLVSAGSAALVAGQARFSLAADSPVKPPVARIEPVAETFFGKAVTDPYRWMENPKDAAWQPFMKGQAAYARSVLDAIPGRSAMAKRVGELSGDLEIVNTMQLGGEN